MGKGIRMLVTLGVALLIGYAAICLLLWVMQPRMVYLPSTPTRGLEATPEDVNLSFDTVQPVTEDGVRLHGWYVRAPNQRGQAVFFHGNAGNISHRLDTLALFADLGLSTLIVDYRGYGRSEGEPSEAGTYRDAEAAWRYLTDEIGADRDDIVVYGRSLGGPVAAWLARERSPAALAVDSSFTSAPDLAQELYPWLPARWLSRFEYATRKHLVACGCPVLVVHSRGDEIIPYRHGRRLFEAAPEPKAFIELEGGHNEAHWLTRERYRAGLGEFLDRHLSPMPARTSAADAKR